MSSDNSEVKFGFAKLGENNYPSWEIDAKGLLLRYGVWRIVSGESSKPSDAGKLESWLEKSDKAAGCIMSIIEDSNKSVIASAIPDPAKMWALLREKHQQKKPAARFAAWQTLLGLSLKEDESLQSLIARGRTLYRNIADLYPTTTGSGEKDKFGIEQLGEELTCMSILRALPFDEYGSFRSQVQMQMRDALTITQLEDMFFLEQTNRSQLVSETANAVRASGSSPKCHFCGREGHLQLSCHKYLEAQKSAQIRARHVAVKAKARPMLMLLMRRHLHLLLPLLEMRPPLPIRLKNSLEMQVPTPHSLPHLPLTGMQTQAPLLT